MTLVCNKKARRFMSVLLVFIMLLSIVPMGASAAQESNYFGHVTFTGTNTGSWHKVNPAHTKARMCVAFKVIDGKSYSTDLYVNAQQYPGVARGSRLWCKNYNATPDSGGYYYYVSEWFTISKGSDIRLTYTATSSGTSYDPRRVDCHVWVDTK